MTQKQGITNMKLVIECGYIIRLRQGFETQIVSTVSGSFVIAEVVSDVNYRLGLPNGCRIHGMVHANRLCRFVDRAQWPEKLEMISSWVEHRVYQLVIRN